MRPNCVSTAVSGGQLRLGGLAHVDVLPVRVERHGNPVARDPPPGGCAPRPRSSPAVRSAARACWWRHRPYPSDTPSGRDPRATLETAIQLHQFAKVRFALPPLADAAGRRAPGSTAPPRASTGAASRDGPTDPYSSPDARPPASARTARASRRRRTLAAPGPSTFRRNAAGFRRCDRRPTLGWRSPSGPCWRKRFQRRLAWR